jgi:hypothetical protein
MIDLYPRVRLDDTQRASLLKELAVLRARLEECETQKGDRSRPVAKGLRASAGGFLAIAANKGSAL